MDLHYSLINNYMLCDKNEPKMSFSLETSSDISSSSSESVYGGLEVNAQNTASNDSRKETENKKTSITEHATNKSPTCKPKKVFACTYCQKVFNRPSALQTHTYTHTAEKPFQCLSPNCGRSFSVVSNLRRHLKVHQKTSASNKLSSEDRLRCVKRLMQKTEMIHKSNQYLDKANHEGHVKQRNISQHNQSNPVNHYRHKFILPVFINLPYFNNSKTIPYYRSINFAQQPASFLLNDSVLHVPESLPNHFPSLAEISIRERQNDTSSSYFNAFTPFSLSEEDLQYSQ